MIATELSYSRYNKLILNTLKLLLLSSIFFRLYLWFLLRDSGYASDEQGYYETGINFFKNGYLDNTWPPIVPILIAFLNYFFNENLSLFRFVWNIFDLLNILLIFIITKKILISNFKNRNLAPYLAALLYSTYIPAISFAQFLTSETFSLFLILLSTSIFIKKTSIINYFFIFLILSILILCRTNLLPIIILVAVVACYNLKKSIYKKVTFFLFFVLLGYSSLFFYLAYNYTLYGKLTLTYGSSYNLYIGNREHYTEDLNIFNPLATKKQILDRRPNAERETLDFTQDEMKELAINYIKDNPAQFLRRSLGRFARIFSPKTSQLQIIGGEGSYSVTHMYSYILLALTFLQYFFFLFFGLMSFTSFSIYSSKHKQIFISIILSALPLCLIAISKPRYSFPFDFIFIIYSISFFFDPKLYFRNIKKNYKLNFTLVILLSWFWISWIIFSLSSREII
jgi:hypothetical protein